MTRMVCAAGHPGKRSLDLGLSRNLPGKASSKKVGDLAQFTLIFGETPSAVRVLVEVDCSFVVHA
jgi:hypothetical protein